MDADLGQWERHGLMQQWLAEEGNRPSREKFIRRYEQHNQNVRSYFSDRPRDLLEVCWETEVSPWQRLCGFLELEPVIDEPFPHENKAPARSVPLESG